MRTGRYPTPGLYHNTEEQYGAYPDISMDLLGDQHSEMYGMDAQYSPLDHSMGKQLGLNNYANPEVARYWNPAEEPLDDASMGRSRHGRSLSLTGDNNFAYHTPERRLRPSYPGSGGYQQQGFNARNPRFNAPPYGTRPTIQPQQGNYPPSNVNRGDGERGQGYRRLWQQVTKVGRGQKLGENTEGMQFSDMTVEDLLRIIRNLSPEESAVQAVSNGLYYLDSRALAALLKELHKLGLTNRAGELFDWLKNLPEGHELSHLCDVYTYTTIISQCGSHQQLRKALELVAEMRSRGIPCNVHTYSALMNVCIKANEMELALDVYGQLQRDGCTPNLVTYNILIDVHGKTGNWREAVKVLDALESQGTKPEVRTYNTIINACNRSQQPEHALKVYDRMISDGTQPTATTYTALISAYGKTGKIEDAIKIFQDMITRGCERNVITYSSLISACEKSGRWELALELFEEMHKDACKPNIVTYNALIAACGQEYPSGGQWETAMNIFNGMDRHNCKPDAITYSVIISAYDRGGEWSRALQAYEEMQNHGHRPDVGVYNILVDVLARLGSQPAFIKSIQLFQTAVRQGQFRMMSQGSHTDTTAIAFTAGAAALALSQWLQDLKAQSSASGLSSPRTSTTAAPRSSPSQPSPAPGSLARTSDSPQGSATQLESPTAGSSSPERAHLVLLKGKHGRAESAPGTIEQACASILTAANIPFSMEQTTQGLRLGLDVDPGQTWQTSKELEVVLAPFIPLSNSSLRRLSIDTLITEDCSIDRRCRTAYAGVQAYEDTHAYSNKMLNQADLDSRGSIVELLVEFCNKVGFQEESIHDSVQLLDRLIFQNLGAHNLSQFILFAAIARILIGQGGNANMPSFASIESASGISADQIEEMEEYVRKALDQDTGTITAYRVLHMYLERLSVDFQEPVIAQRVAGNALQAISLVIYESNLAVYPPSVVAASVLFLARRQAGTYPFWPRTLADLTGYLDPEAGLLKKAIEHASPLFALKESLRMPSLASVPSVFSTSAVNPTSNAMSVPASQLSLGSLPSGPQPSPSGIRRSTSAVQSQLVHTRSGGITNHLRHMSLSDVAGVELPSRGSVQGMSRPLPQTQGLSTSGSSLVGAAMGGGLGYDASLSSHQ